MAAELAEAEAALSTYESQLASADHAKASALAEVQNMLDEMQQLQDLQAMIERENKQLQRAAAAKAATKTSGVKRAGSQKQIAAAAEARNAELEEQVKRLEARVSQLEQENLLLRQRDVMGKMLNLGRKTAADAAPASSSKDTEEKTPTPKPAFLHQFTQKQLVVFEPLADFDTIETTPVNLAREEETMERRDSQEIDQKRKLTMMTLFTRRCRQAGPRRSDRARRRRRGRRSRMSARRRTTTTTRPTSWCWSRSIAGRPPSTAANRFVSRSPPTTTPR